VELRHSTLSTYVNVIVFRLLNCVADDHRRQNLRFDVPPLTAECAIERLGRIEGSVVDERQRPLDSAIVTVEALRLVARTGEDGSFVLKSVEAGQHRLEVSASGFRAEELDLVLSPGEHVRHEPTMLAPGWEIMGRVVDALTGEAVEGAEIAIVSPRFGDRATSDHEGTFLLRGGSQRGVRIQARSEGFAPKTVEISAEQMLGDYEPVEIALSSGGNLKVVVWDEERGERCSGCALSLYPRPLGVSLRTDANGEAFAANLEPGEYRLGLDSVSNLGSVVTVRTGVRTRSVEIEPGVTTTVELGRPSRTILLQLYPPPPPGWDLEVGDQSASRVFRQEGDGRYQVELRRNALLFLVERGVGLARKVLIGRFPEAYEGDELRLDLSHSSVAGRLVDDDVPMVGRPVQLVATTGEGRAWAHSTEGGRFRFPFVSPGAYVVLSGSTLLSWVNVAGDDTIDLGDVATPEERDD
jgi:hypothetical protein